MGGKNVTDELYQIMLALAGNLESVCYVCLQDESWRSYALNGERSALCVQSEGSRFFRDYAEFVSGVLVPEDADLLKEEFNRESVLDEIRREGQFFRQFLMATGEGPMHYEIRVVPAFDGEHLVCAARKTKERAQIEFPIRAELAEAKSSGNYDAMTDILNRYAYQIATERLDADIRAGTCGEFALVVCDLNNLKYCNDVLGHKVGDQLIKDASHFITSVFAESTVYRIGGDEFAVLLRGRGYQNRFKLLERLRRQNRSYPSGEYLVIASGLSAFDPNTDSCVSDVFGRADREMYRNKVELKAKRIHG